MIEKAKAETIIYDQMAKIKKHAAVLVPLLNSHGTIEEKEAYTTAMYSVVTALGIVIGQEAIDRGKVRHDEIDKEVKEYFANNPIKPNI